MTEIEDRWRDLGAFIREQRRVGQLSLRKLSEMAGISNPYLSQIERGLRHPSAEILRNIAGALSISAETLYVRAGILDERDGEHDLVADIRRDPYIDEEQKKTLVHIYQSFRAAFLAGAGADAAVVAAAGPAMEGVVVHPDTAARDTDDLGADGLDALDPDALDPDSLDPDAFDPDALDPDGVDPIGAGVASTGPADPIADVDPAVAGAPEPDPTPGEAEGSSPAA